MALKVKAKEQLIKVGKYADTYRFVLSPELYIALATDKVIQEAALRSGISKGVMQACWDAAGEVIKAWATALTWDNFGFRVQGSGLTNTNFSNLTNI